MRLHRTLLTAYLALFCAGANATIFEYFLSNKDPGSVAPPDYGLRLDNLFGSGSDTYWTFSFNQTDVRMVIDDVANTAHIFGDVIGGRDMDQTEWTVGAPGANTWYLDFTFRDIVVTDPNTGFWTASGNTGGIDADSSGFLVFKDDADIDGDGNSDLLRGIGLADYRDGTPGWFNIGGPAPQGPYVSSWLADTTGFVDMQTFVPNDPNSYNRSGACCKDFGYRAERVPEPAGVMLMGLGLLGLLRTRRRT